MGLQWEPFLVPEGSPRYTAPQVNLNEDVFPEIWQLAESRGARKSRNENHRKARHACHPLGTLECPLCLQKRASSCELLAGGSRVRGGYRDRHGPQPDHSAALGWP